MLYEMRTYETTQAGVQPLAERFGTVVMPLYEKHGIQNVGYWTPVIGQPTDRLIFMLGYKDMAHYEQSHQTLRQDPEWQQMMQRAQQGGGPQVLSIHNMFLQNTPYSPPILSDGYPKGPAAVCDLRIYDILPGKMQIEHDRFANITIRLLEKSGATNIGYWTPVVGGYNTHLYYMVGFESMAQREEASKAFGQDPEWQAAQQEAREKHGELVKSRTLIILQPTAFSPIR